jgi:glyoxylase-like metal-dependent hydrolase (beta-lactamase superfamily II)
MQHLRTTIDADVQPRFTAIYLRTAGDEAAFIETNTAHAAPRAMAALAERGLRPEQVRWVVVTHAHLDHAAGASALLERCPNATLLAHPRAARHLVDPSKLVASATAVYGAARFAELYGEIAPIPSARVRALEDGDTFELGDAKLQAIHTAGHAKHHFIVDDPAVDSVYTGDTFGLVYPALQRGVRFAIPSTSPTDFDAVEAHKSIDKVVALGRGAACLTHFDEVRDQTVVAAQLHALVDRSEALRRRVADGEAVDLRSELRAAFDETAWSLGLTLEDADWGLLRTDLDLNAQGIQFAARR